MGLLGTIIIIKQMLQSQPSPQECLSCLGPCTVQALRQDNIFELATVASYSKSVAMIIAMSVGGAKVGQADAL